MSRIAPVSVLWLDVKAVLRDKRRGHLHRRVSVPLITFWKSEPGAVAELSIEQVVAMAGDGILRDNSACSEELKDYFKRVSSEKLAQYVEQCLSSSFNKSGIVLQDLVNELGRRLDYSVINGRYQGTAGSIGFDGIWVAPEGHTVIAEVKTTDAYRISLDTIVGYRQQLLAAGKVSGEPSILIVVGRQDTGELEAQVRGSRHAWEVRLISVEALIKLVKLKENSDEPETGGKIRSVLMPVEYTRLDRLVDVMFTTATDVEAPIVEAGADSGDVAEEVDATIAPAEQTASSGTWEFTDAALLQWKRDDIIKAVSRGFGEALIKKSRALYWSPDHERRIACTISKRYKKKGAYPYWYAYHPQWDEFLRDAQEGLLLLGCMDLSVAFAIPRKEIAAVLDDLNTTDAQRGMYWHLHILQRSDGNHELLIPRRTRNLDLSPYTVHLTSS